MAASSNFACYPRLTAAHRGHLGGTKEIFKKNFPFALCQVLSRGRERLPMDTAQASRGLVRLQKIVTFRDYLSRHQKARTSREEIAILGAVEDLLERIRRSLSAEA